MEDTIAEGFKGHRQLPYAHWICFLISQAVCQIPPQIADELIHTTTEFLAYDTRQLVQGRGPPPVR
jgi:hypothetical protein